MRRDQRGDKTDPAPNLKRAKKEADAIVSKAVAFQAKLEERSDSLSGAETAAGLDSAISMYEQALALCPHHADACYNWAVAVLEKLELGCSQEVLAHYISVCLDKFGSIIQRDTSLRAETSGLAHRATGNLIREHFDTAVAVMKISERDLISCGKSHFEESIRILAGSRSMDMYLLDYGRYQRFSLDRLLSDPGYSFQEKVQNGRLLTAHATQILGSCLQTECQNDLDLDVYIESSEVSLNFLQFLLAHVGSDWGRVPPDSCFCVANLLEREAAILAIKDAEDAEADETLKDIYETLVVYYSSLNDVKNCLSFCGRLIRQIENGTGNSADRGDCIFCIGTALIKSDVVVAALSCVSNCDIIDDLGEEGRFVLAYIRSCGESGLSEHLRLPSTPRLIDMCLYAAAVQYEKSLSTAQIASAVGIYHPAVDCRKNTPLSGDDIGPILFNLVCIAWNLKDEGYCVDMLSKYFDLLRSQNYDAPMTSILDQLVADVRNDTDLRGLAESEWFRCFMEQKYSISSS